MKYILLLLIFLVACSAPAYIDEASKQFWSKCEPGDVSIGTVRAQLTEWTESHFGGSEGAALNLVVIGYENNLCHIRATGYSTDPNTRIVVDIWARKDGTLVRVNKI